MVLSLFCFLLMPYAVTLSLESHPTTIHEPGWAVCGAEEFPCGNTSICLDRSLHCDGIAHCDNGEDEAGCDDVHGSLKSLIKDMGPRRLVDVSSLPYYNNCTLQHVPLGCVCRNLIWLYCLRLNLTSIPQGLSRHITKLVLTNNSISRLHQREFVSYPNLRVIQLEGNKIRYLPQGTFADMNNVGFLILSRNELRTLEMGVFEDMVNLTWLELRQNRLEDFDLKVFSHTPSLHLLDLTGNSLMLKGLKFPPLLHLFWLALENNRIEVVEKDSFSNLRSLEVLILKNNRIRTIEQKAFFKLENLVELDISYNRLRNLRPRIFENLKNLSKLNLQYNSLLSLPLQIFTTLMNLKSLDLQGMEITNIDIHHFQSLANLEFIYFKKFHYCSYAPYVRICTPKTDGLSSTEHLLVWPILRMSVWIVALMTCIGNSIVLTWRILSRKEDHVLSLFIKNLSVADLLMGVYLLAIGAQDVAFRDCYNKFAHAWMSSWHCTVCGIIAMVSCEVSVFILSLITLERYRCIRNNDRVVTVNSARYSLIVVWGLGLALAFFPIVQWSHDHGFYSSNGLCFPLHIHDPYLLGWQYSALVFLGINFTIVVLIIIFYLRMFLIIKHDRKFARPVLLKKHEDAVLALRFFFIVLTDCLCWIPIVIVKLVALTGTTISDDLYACMVVLILPINSALNPVIYTIAAPTELRRRLEKWIERIGVCLQGFECLFISDPKTPVSSPLTQSLTTTTEGRKESSSSMINNTVHLCASSNKNMCHISHREESAM